MNPKTGFFGVLLLLLAAIALLMIGPFAQYIAAAALLAFMLMPLHRRLHQKVGNRPSAFILVITTLIAAIIPFVIITAIILETIRTFAADPKPLFTLISDFEETIESITGIEIEILVEVEDILVLLIDTLFDEILTVATVTVRAGLGAIIIVFVLYYLLVDGDGFVVWLKSILPLEPAIQNELFEESKNITWAVLRSHIFIAVIEGILGGIGLYLAGVPNAAFWTVVMIVTSILPIIGVWFVWGPAVVYLILADQMVPAVLLLLYGLTVLAFIDNYLRAIFVDRRAGLNPAVVLIGVIGGLYLFGFVGLFLGPIVLAIFKATITVFGRTYGDLDGTDTNSNQVG